MKTEAVLITPDEFSKISAEATTEFVKMFEEQHGKSKLSIANLLLGTAFSSIMMKLIFNREKNGDD